MIVDIKVNLLDQATMTSKAFPVACLTVRESRNSPRDGLVELRLAGVTISVDRAKLIRALEALR